MGAFVKLRSFTPKNKKQNKKTITGMISLSITFKKEIALTI